MQKALKNIFNRKGFTLIELLAVITILGLLAALIIPKMVGVTEGARRDTAKIQIKNFVRRSICLKWTTAFSLPPNRDLPHW